MKKHSVADVVAYFRGEPTFAVVMNVNRVSVRNWMRDERLPLLQALMVEALSGGKFNRHALPLNAADRKLVQTTDLSQGMLRDRHDRLRHVARFLTERAEVLKKQTSALTTA